MQVPFIDLARFTREISAEVLADWQGALERSEFVGGAPVQALEAKLAELLGARHVVACGSGSDALVLALAARGLKAGDRVAVPNCTFWATYEAVVQLGAVPVLVDVDPTDFQLSFAALARAHQRFPVRAAILVHAYGWASGSLGQFRAFCREHEIWLLEDAAQAYGVECEGRSVFADADMATLSFYPAKVIGGSQDGGAVLVRDDELAARIRSLANHGRRAHYSYDHVGWNSRMGAPNAYFLLRALARASDVLAWRRRATAFYREALATEPRLRFHGPPPGVRENGYLSVATLDGPSQELTVRLRQRGVGCARTWPETLDVQGPAVSALKAEPLEASRALSRSVLNLPVFYGITAAEQSFVVEALQAELR